MKTLIPFLDVGDVDFYYHLLRSLAHDGAQVEIAYLKGNISETWSDLGFIKLPQETPRKSWGLLLQKEYCKPLRDVKADVIFVLSELWALSFAYKCSKSLKIPYVVWLRGDHRRVREVRRINPAKRIVSNALEVFLLNKAEYVIPNSLSLREKALEWGVKSEKVTEPAYNGVDTDFFKPLKVQRPSEFTVGYAGRLSPEKRFDALVRIAGELKDIRFLITGPRPPEASLPPNVEYIGRLPFNRMPYFYNMIDLLALPSATESFPSVILEAYATAKPVLATPEAFPRELEVYGSVAPLERFAEEIQELRKADLHEIGRKAREYVAEKFTWKAFADTVLKYLNMAASYS